VRLGSRLFGFTLVACGARRQTSYGTPVAEGQPMVKAAAGKNTRPILRIGCRLGAHKTVRWTVLPALRALPRLCQKGDLA